MNQFDAFGFGAFLIRLEARKCELTRLRAVRGGDSPLSQAELAEFGRLLEGTYELSVKIPFGDAIREISMMEQYIRADATLSRMCSEVERLSQTIIKQLSNWSFLFIASDRKLLVDNDLLFGDPVKQAFPRAVPDIREAGNCLAAECNTAAVFHLMRVAECGLRALARDHRIKMPKKAVLDLATWESIIRELEASEGAIQSYTKTPAGRKRICS